VALIINRKKLLVGPLSRWRPEKIAETRMFSDVAGMNTCTVTEQMQLRKAGCSHARCSNREMIKSQDVIGSST